MIHPINTLDVGEGRPLIFQHGLAARAQQIHDLLQGIDMRLITIDCPGHGKSKLSDDVNLSFDYYTDVLINQVDQLGIDKAIFGGLSMGSGIALNVAIRYPDRVTALILHRPAWLDKGFPENLMKLKDGTQMMRMENGIELFKKTPAFINLEQELPAAAASVLGIFSPDQQAGLDQIIEQMVGDSPITSLDQLGQLSIPCLILANEDDPLHPFEMAKVINERIDKSILKKITSRYLDPLKHKEEVQSHISEFIKSIE